MSESLPGLLSEIRSCTVCAESLELGPRPVMAAGSKANIAIIGQAPGKKVHLSGVPWDDPSGKRLREWMGVSEEEFYDENRIAIIPMGFCYPGKGSSGDLPPRPECAPLWHQRLLNLLPNIELTLLIGQYAQAAYLGEKKKANLTETVRSYQEYLPQYLPIPHPSPRNRFWLAKNPWFTDEVIPMLQKRVANAG